MIVITLTSVPPALRGELSKWCQEIQVGIFVGNPSARIRDLLWDKIVDNVGQGRATMAFNARNEFGYQFRTTNRYYEVRDYDGIPLLVKVKDATPLIKVAIVMPQNLGVQQSFQSKNNVVSHQTFRLWQLILRQLV
ncbi:type I-E CRISPR-associated endoribonuclease Cas2e [Amylolactobacillus amylophilus]|uniref:type I-E CRISPR-associated endoribonuclease Cas2e n=1 Tax=Amylolactobacillus amylophilus TaxID=1603 RepID=UPI000A9A970F|nr:type I-E CRISPR-associated endoribonuclease Cas2e [Amylolactobacillus amylophilus]